MDKQAGRKISPDLSASGSPSSPPFRPVPRHLRVRHPSGRAWQRDRKKLLFDHPLCSGPDSRCEKEGRIVASAQVDHIHDLEFGGKHEPSNWQFLCAACNYEKKCRTRGLISNRALQEQAEQDWNRPSRRNKK